MNKLEAYVESHSFQNHNLDRQEIIIRSTFAITY
jgi:hypothetical protein